MSFRRSNESMKVLAPGHKSGRRASHATRPSHTQATSRPLLAYRQRGPIPEQGTDGSGPGEIWHAPRSDGQLRYRVCPPGAGYVHPVSVDEIRARLAELPPEFVAGLEVVQLSPMTRKRRLFPCYGMQWGAAIYLYPIEVTLVEKYVRPPTPQQQIEARMYGGEWTCEGSEFRLIWTPETIRDFYLNNVLIHEVGHIVDQRNRNPRDRERYANWFAIEYGYRASRCR